MLCVLQVMCAEKKEKRALIKNARAHERTGKQKTKVSIKVIMIGKLLGSENELWIRRTAKWKKNRVFSDLA